MRDIFNSHPVSVLKKEISKTNIKGYSSMNKKQIVDLMMKNIERFKHIKMAVKKPRKKRVPREKKPPRPKKAPSKPRATNILPIPRPGEFDPKYTDQVLEFLDKVLEIQRKR
tara:strand:+ start:465 stop:800 length:336 start_codon:yes stop_codon:yes gene_type:complete